MCYPKPGPRCSTHAAARLKAAIESESAYTGTDLSKKRKLRERIISARKEYYTSPKGIKSLEDNAAKTGDAKDAELATLMKERRAKMITAYKEMQAKMDAEQLPPLPEVKISPLREPYTYGLGVHFYSVDYEYDANYCTGDTCDSEYSDGYCRDSIYEGLRIKDGPVNSRAVLAQIFNTNESNIPDDLVRMADDELDMDNPESYDVHAVNGYYGEEVEVHINNEAYVAERLRSYYLNMPDANDEGGILPYLRGKGLNTVGLTPIEAVKKHLRDENRGNIVDYVEKTNVVSKKRIDLSDVKIPQKHHFDTVAPRDPLSPDGVEKICGIVVKKDRAFFLVDGYHRLKHELEREQFAGNFIVLETKN